MNLFIYDFLRSLKFKIISKYLNQEPFLFYFKNVCQAYTEKTVKNNANVAMARKGVTILVDVCVNPVGQGHFVTQTLTNAITLKIHVTTHSKNAKIVLVPISVSAKKGSTKQKMAVA